MERRAVVILYVGEQATQEALRGAVEALSSRIPMKLGDGAVEVTTLNEDELLQAITGKILTQQIKVCEYEASELDDAVAYIGTEFARAIISGPIDFTSNVAARYISAIHNYDDDQLKKAVRIIAKGDFDNISPVYRKKYNFSADYFEIIRNIYKQCAGQFA